MRFKRVMYIIKSICILAPTRTGKPKLVSPDPVPSQLGSRDKIGSYVGTPKIKMGTGPGKPRCIAVLLHCIAFLIISLFMHTHKLPIVPL